MRLPVGVLLPAVLILAGSEGRYTNLGYVVLAALIEKQSGVAKAAAASRGWRVLD